MKLTNNTVFITGGGTGIGRGLAAEFHKRGNKVIISGRRKDRLEQTVKEFPGMQYVVLDVENPASIKEVTKQLIKNVPNLNVLINNAGIMQFDDLSTEVDEKTLVSTVTTNLLGPIRVTSALVEHLKKQESAYILNVSSVLAFVPLAVTGIYSSTKAALHSYSLSLRYKLKNTSVKVLEVSPPWVQTDLLNSNEEPRAMPLKPFIAETMKALETDANEILVERVRPLRNNVGPQDEQNVDRLNDGMLSGDMSVTV
jgi:uncharacterized oxidoreductase